MIYIVRHGQTDWNLIKKIQGRQNISLNNFGLEQAFLVKEKLTGIKFDKIFSSPLKRALQTAQVISPNDIITDNRLIERDNGELEGKIVTECKELPDFNNPNDTRFGIEPLLDFRKRINAFLDEIKEKYKNKNILVVTHAGVSIYMRCYFEGEPSDNNYSKLKLKNCEILKYSN